MKIHSFFRILMIVATLSSASACQNGGGQDSDKVPLVSIPAPSSLAVSISRGIDPETLHPQAIAAIDPESAPSGYLFTLKNASGESDTATLLANGTVEPLRVDAEPGERVSITQTDIESGVESSALEISVPESRFNGGGMDLVDLDIRAQEAKAYVLGNDRSTQAASLQVFDLETQSLSNPIDLLNGSASLTHAHALRCLSDSTICIVIFQDDARRIATIDRGSGALIAEMSNLQGDNEDLLLLGTTAFVTTTDLDSGSVPEVDLLYIDIDPVSGALTASGGIDLPAPASDIAISRSLLAANTARDAVYVLEKTESDDVTTLLAYLVDATTQTASDPIAYAVDGLALTGPYGIAAFSADAFADLDHLLLSQSADTSLFDVQVAVDGVTVDGLNIGEPTAILYGIDEHTETPQGPNALSVHLSDDCAATDVLVLGYSADRFVAHFDMSEETDGSLVLDAALESEIGLGADGIETACVGDTLVTLVFSTISDDITFIDTVE